VSQWVEHLSRKCKDLSSNLKTTERERERERKRKREILFKGENFWIKKKKIVPKWKQTMTSPKGYKQVTEGLC
jgi:hypothetical protein